MRRDGAIVVGRRGAFERGALAMSLYTALADRYGADRVIAEYEFAKQPTADGGKVRRWRFDLAVRGRDGTAKVAVELQGFWSGGHAGAVGYRHDVEKFREAAARGWLIVPVTYAELKYDLPGILSAVRRAVEARR